jgi:adenylate cyclase, class 2
MNEQELEVKFLVSDLAGLARRLETLGATLVQPRIFESNLRFDDPKGSLTRSGQALRLRQDTRSILTYKGTGRVEGDVNVRQEIEFSVSDYGAARRFLEALGYQVTVLYEKYRTSYDLDKVHVVLDELPYGKFAEIEGPSSEAIQATAARLGLVWALHSNDTYLGLFTRLRSTLRLNMRDLSFANFSGLVITPQDLGIRLADTTG